MKTRSSRNLVSLFLILSLPWLSMPARSSAVASAPAAGHSKGITFDRPPLRFEVNEGQADPQVRFTARDRDGISFLTSGGAVFQITQAVAAPDLKPGLKKAALNPEAGRFESSFVRLRTVGANPNPQVVGLDRLPGVTNYFIGNDPQKWRTNVAGYARVKYEGVYPGIDLVYYANKEGRLEYDFIVAPGADPNQIVLAIDGARGTELDAAGDLIISAATGTIRKPAPQVFQEIDGQQQEIAAGYKILQAEDANGNREPATGNQLVAFALAAYDLNRPLVIDPEVIYATYLGGSSTSTVANEGAGGVAVDAQGSAYILGVTQSADFPTQNPLQGVLRGRTDSFITKLDANGQMVYSTYLGGSDFDGGAAIKVDETGAVYIGGGTNSFDFPTVNPIQGVYGLRSDAFITKLSPEGSQIVYSTYLGGAATEGVTDLALDAEKNLFAVGNIFPALGVPANDFPTVNPIQATHGGGSRDGFMSVINPSGSSLRFSTYLGGDGDDFFQSIGLDSSNRDVFLGFFTDSTNFAASSSSVLAQANGGTPRGVVARLKIDSLGGLLLFTLVRTTAHFFTASSIDRTLRVKKVGQVTAFFILRGIVDAFSDRSSQSEPLSAQAVQPQAGGGLDVRLDALDQNLNVTNTLFFGGSGEDTLSTLEIDAQGAAYIIGHTRSTDLPTVNPIQANPSGGNAFEGFLAVLHPQTLQPIFATYLGGTGGEFLNGITVDPQGNIYVVGETFGNFPNPTPGAIQSQLRGRTDAFIIKISPVEISDAVQFGNWESVPGGGLTSAGPEAVSLNNDLWAFVRGTDDHVYQNRLTAGSWTGWSEVPGGGLTSSGPEAVVFNNVLHLFVRGTDGRVYLNSLSGTTWTGWNEVPGGGLTPSEPGAAVFNNALHLFVRGMDDRVYLNSLSDTTWTGWNEVPGGGLTGSGPTASEFQSTLYVAVRGTDGRLYDNLHDLAGSWTGWREVPGGGLTSSGPGSAAFNGQLWYFVQGTDNRVYQNRLAAGAGGTWTGWSEVPGGGLTPSGPEAAATSSTLFLFVRGTDNGVYVNHAP